MPDVFQSHTTLSIIRLENNYFTGAFPKMPVSVTQCELYPNNAFDCYYQDDSACFNINIAGTWMILLFCLVCTNETRPEALRTPDCIAMKELLPLERITDIACCQIQTPQIQVTCDNNLRVTSLYDIFPLTIQIYIVALSLSITPVSEWNTRKYWKLDRASKLKD